MNQLVARRSAIEWRPGRSDASYPIETSMKLEQYQPVGFSRGRPAWVEALWWLVQETLVASWLPGSLHRRVLLRIFGARIGRGVTIKPRVRIKFPWRLSIGDYSWLGEGVWIDNLGVVEIGSNCCVSQGVYFCTGNHNWSKEAFDLVVQPIRIEDQCWLAAGSIIGPGVTAGKGAVLVLGGVASRGLREGWIHRGNPAEPFKQRRQKQ